MATSDSDGLVDIKLVVVGDRESGRRDDETLGAC
jgi:hypothetical protein